MNTPTESEPSATSPQVVNSGFCRLYSRDPQVRLEAIQSHLFPDGSLLFQDMNRERFINLWAKTVAEAVGGIDDKTEGYQTRLQPHIDYVTTRCSVAEAEEVLDTLSHAVESQKALAFHIEDCARKATDSLQTQVQETFADLEKISDKKALLSFLADVPSVENVETFRSTDATFSSDQLTTFHREFWSQKRKTREEFVGKVLNVETPGFKIVFARVAGPILKSFLPPESESSKGDGTSANEIGHKAAEAFVRVADPNLLVEACSAMMTALYHEAINPKSEDRQELFGYRLGYFCAHWSGMNKAAQYGHSLPITPDSWMPGLASSKDDADGPSRAEFWRWTENKPDHLQQALQKGRLTNHEGTGSYISTYGMELPDEYLEEHREEYSEVEKDQELVLSQLKPGARRKTNRILNLLINICDDLSRQNQEARTTARPLKRLLMHCQKMVNQETDLRYSKKQDSIASAFYKKIMVKIGFREMRYYTAGAFEVGKDFRTSRCVKGAHFNHLLKNGASEEELIEYALFNLLPELFGSFAAFGVDHDRHGNQQGNERKKIGIFDLGGFPLENPTKKQIRDATHFLIDVVLNSRRNKYSFLSSLKHNLGLIGEQGVAVGQPDYEFLESIQRTLVSYGDFLKPLLKNPRYLKAGALAVVKTGTVNGALLWTIARRIMSSQGLRIPFLGPLIFRKERRRRSVFYPDNPNPFFEEKKAKKKANKTKSEKKKTVPEIKIEYTGKLKKSILGRLLGVAVKRIKV